MTHTPISDPTIFRFRRFFYTKGPCQFDIFSKEVDEFHRIITLCCSL